MNKPLSGKKAVYYRQEGANTICLLCPHQCLIKPDQRGRCLSRKNEAGVLQADSYGKVTSLALDPVRKKPLNRFYSDHNILTVGSFGCNLGCRFCQNHEISQQKTAYTYYEPGEILNLALYHTLHNNIGLAFSYNEPGIAFEYVKDCFKLIKDAALKTVLVTNGFLAEEPFAELTEITDAMNIDLKSFRQDFYAQICGADLATVQNNLKTAAAKCHLEVTTLLIPDLNDSSEEIEAMASWLATIDANIPYHISRFFPRYKMDNLFPTPLATMERAADIAGEYLNYVYLGNV